MYFGSVRFFKNLILLAVVVMIAIPSGVAFRQKGQLEQQSRQIAGLQDAVAALEEQAQQVMLPLDPEPDDGLDEDVMAYQTLYPDFYAPQELDASQKPHKTIYLTFDDGPSQHTEKLLDVLAKYDVKVSFFVKNSSYLDIITRADREGHTVAVHTYSHDYNKIYASEEAFYADMSAIRKLIAKYTSNATSLIRFPGGSSNTISQLYNRGIMTRLAKALTEMGYTYFDWNVDSDDAGRARTPEEVFNNITKGLRWYNDAVVLQHDTKEYSINAVERIIVWALIKGYSFKPLTENSPTCHHPINN